MASGSLTQWVFEEGYCGCGRNQIQPESEGTAPELCSKCGKRMAMGRAGSLTQWIFREDQCACERTLNVVSEPKMPGPTSNSFREPEAEETFPPSFELDFPIERYKPLRCLGQGSIGSVFKCFDRQLSRIVAVKVLNSLNKDELMQFQHEARASAQLTDPGIVRTLDFGISSGDKPFMVMTFVDGHTLSHHLSSHGPLSIAESLLLAHQLASALASAHKAGIYHRDVKPTNIVVGLDPLGLVEKATLIDFGIAKFRKLENLSDQQPTLAGTPLYMSPDQAQGQDYDACSEIYSLGCVIFETLIGQPPFQADSALQLLNLHAHAVPPTVSSLRADVMPESALDKLIYKCLAKAKENRFQSMVELVEGLEALANPSGSLPVKPDIPVKPQGKSLYRQGLVVAALLSATLAGLFLVGLTINHSETKPQTLPLRISRASDSEETLRTKNMESIDGMFNVAEGLIERAKPKTFEYKDMVSTRINVAGPRYACDEFVMKLDLPDQYFTELLAKDGPISDKGFEYLGQRFRTIHLTCTNLPNVTDKGVIAMLKSHQLNSINLDQLRITKALLQQIALCPALRLLEIRKSDMHGGKISQLPPSLKSLTMRHAKLDDSDLDEVLALKELMVIDFTGNDLSDAGLAKLSSLQNLRAIFISANRRITPTGVEEFQKRNPSCSVNHTMPYKSPVHYEVYFDDRDLPQQFALHPKEMNLSNWRVTNRGLESLVGKRIKSLNLVKVPLSDSALPIIAKMQTLKRLDISGIPAMTDEGLKSLSALKNLEQLAISGNKFSDKAVAAVCDQFPNLLLLNARDTRVSKETFKVLAKKKRFKNLFVTKCELRDDDVVLIAKCPALRSLEINQNPKITARGLMALANAKLLIELEVDKLDTDALERLRNTLPRVQVISN